MVLEPLVDWSIEFIRERGMLGLFVIMVIGSSPIPIPVEVVALTAISLGAPTLPTALFAAVGATIGGLFSYYVGKGFIHVSRLRIRYEERLQEAHEWLDKYGTVSVFIFAFTPLPYDAIALAAGAVKMRKRKFVAATFLGRLLRYSLLVVAGQGVLKYLSPIY